MGRDVVDVDSPSWNVEIVSRPAAIPEQADGPLGLERVNDDMVRELRRALSRPVNLRRAIDTAQQR